MIRRMPTVEPDRFLSELNKMYERRKQKKSVWVTLKRSDVPSKPCKGKRPVGDPSTYKCLVRASDGKKSVSTSVAGPQQAKFQQSLVLIMKAHMDALKKKEKSKPEKSKEAAA